MWTAMEDPPAYSDYIVTIPNNATTESMQQSSRGNDAQFPVKIELTHLLAPSGEKSKKTSAKHTDVILLSTDLSYADLKFKFDKRGRELFHVSSGSGATQLTVNIGTEAHRRVDQVTFDQENCRAILMMLKRRENMGHEPWISTYFWTAREQEEDTETQVLQKPVDEEEDIEKVRKPSSGVVFKDLKRWWFQR